jgi:alpha-mannosidase
VRVLPNGGDSVIAPLLESPFTLSGARNVILETVKRGEDDDFKLESGSTSVVLRLYEAFGGHGQVQLNISKHLPIAKAFATNFLEDEEQELTISRTPNGNTCDEDHAAACCSLSLSFRGFEVKTIKLVIGTPPYTPSSPTTKESVLSTAF